MQRYRTQTLGAERNLVSILGMENVDAQTLPLTLIAMTTMHTAAVHSYTNSTQLVRNTKNGCIALYEILNFDNVFAKIKDH